MKTLARSLRPKLFSQVVGRELVCSMLQNSLFLNKIFSSYLFSGQRGCGKTTVARIFAAAVNCQKLPSFRTDPKTTIIPCYDCGSCLSMSNGSHPDFFELDAASNTGVENIRQILESAGYQPCSGKYKVFLIDEAHMLSKSAFNALLKTLEEPPSTAIFILATTEIDKIPLTIRSRSFLGFFPNLEPAIIFTYLKKVCDSEKILIEDSAIDFICKLSGGCPRDALNLLDQLSLSGQLITEKLARKIFGFLSIEKSFRLSRYLAEGDLKTFKNYFMQEVKFKSSPGIFFEQLFSTFILLFNFSLGVKEFGSEFSAYVDDLKFIVSSFGPEKIYLLLQVLKDAQKTILLSTEKNDFLELLMLELFFTVNVSYKPLLGGFTCERLIDAESSCSPEVFKKPKSGLSQAVDVFRGEAICSGDLSTKIKNICQSKKLINLKMVCTAIGCLENIILDEENKKIELFFSNQLNIFLQKELDSSQNVVLDAILDIYFGGSRDLRLADWKIYFFYQNVDKKSSGSAFTGAQEIKKKGGVSGAVSSVNGDLDFSEKTKWPISNLLIEQIPGKIVLDKG